MPRKFITAALPYVNNQPHLGNVVGCVLGADIYARYCRKRGDDVIYISGTDEYGTATEMEAMKQKVHPREIVQRNRVLHKRVYDWMDIAFDNFGHTDCEEHVKMTQDIFRRCRANGYFEARDDRQFYCGSCEQFLADRYVEGTCGFCKYEDARGDQCDLCGECLKVGDLSNVRCAICRKEPSLQPTRHLYLRLDLLQVSIRASFEERKERWSKKAECIYNDWIKKEIHPRCMTRLLKHRWGVPVPLEGFEDKVFYVWFDAPIGYFTFLSQIKPDWEKWAADAELVQFMGKDNVPFHSIIFPGMVLAAADAECPSSTRLPLVSVINSTDYLQFNGEKFSKSRKVGIFGLDLVEKDMGTPDMWRYYLTKIRPETGDSNCSVREFIETVKSDLISNIGNLFNRVLKFINKRNGGRICVEARSDFDTEFIASVNALFTEYRTAMSQALLRKALQIAMAISQRGNQYLQRFVQNPERIVHGFSLCYSVLVLLAHTVEPFMPATAEKMFALCLVPEAERSEMPTELKLVESAEISKEPVVLFAPLTDAQIANLLSYDTKC